MRSEDLVRRFLGAWATPGQWRQALRDYLTADCVYENVGLSRTVGPEQAIAFVDEFNKQSPFASMSVEMLNLVDSGNIVMTERIDHFHDQSGTRYFSIPVMGVFELAHERISAWRDYCDLSAFKETK
jgi:limonene-1,2-epoxide hydrolase